MTLRKRPSILSWLSRAIVMAILVASPDAAGLEPAAGSIASITILDPDSGLATKEVVVNEGNVAALDLLVLDTDGIQRTDFPLTYRSLDTAVATVDSRGNITGRRPGFSTLTITSGSVVATGTITVVGVDAGAIGYTITGLAADRAGRLYLADTSRHAILLAASLRSTPNAYAGVSGTAGFRDAPRLEALFREPGFVAVNQATGVIYSSDTGNHRIRSLRPGTEGRVATLAGSGVEGSIDDTGAAASFNRPQGVALDHRGYLWVVDSGNHTIRRISLVSKTVETIAGLAGAAGRSDGTGSAARFNAPMGIALETEPLLRQFERERKGEPPPPVRMIVADTGNGALRRVTEDGRVETLESTSSPPSRAVGAGARARAPLAFASPTGVAVDAVGGVYVSEPANNRVRLVLPDGTVVPVVQTGTVTSPKGIAIGELGKVLVADGARASREARYGVPAVTSVTPERIGLRGGETVTVRGANFSSETTVVLGSAYLHEANVIDSGTITFVAPKLASGSTNLSIQNRGGVAQRSFFVEPPSLAQTPVGYITTVAGGGTYTGDGGRATEAALADPGGAAFDFAGNLFVADTSHNRVRRIDAITGFITTVAGNGREDFSGDGGPATAASLSEPRDVIVDASGNLLVADYGNGRVRKVDVATGTITTVAGTGFTFTRGDGIPALEANVSPAGVALDSVGNLIIADRWNNRVWKVDAKTTILTKIAGTGDVSYIDPLPGDGRPASAAKVSPEGVAIDPSDNIFVADPLDCRIRRIDATTGTITTVAGNRLYGFSGDGGPATAASLSWPNDVEVDPSGNLFISDLNNRRVRKVDAATGIITTIAGNGLDGSSGDGGPATEAAMRPASAAIDSGGTLFVSDRDRIRRVDARTNGVTTIAGGTFADGGPATAGLLLNPSSIALDRAGNIFVADDSRVRRIDSTTGVVTTVAGNGRRAYSGDGGPATEAGIQPTAIGVDPQGNVFIGDFNLRVRKVDSKTGIITTVAGTGERGFSGDGGLATAARLESVPGIAVNTQGALFIADSRNNRVRKVDSETGIITTVAGDGRAGFSGDGGPATSATLEDPLDVIIDPSGNLLIADFGNSRVRKVDAENGVITTIAGGGTGADGSLATAAAVAPAADALDRLGNLFIVDAPFLGGTRIRKVDASTGRISTVAGKESSLLVQPSSLDGAPATGVTLGLRRSGITLHFGRVDATLDAAGNIVIADAVNGRIRAVRGPGDILPCNYSVSPASYRFSHAATTGSLAVSTSSRCGWSTESDSVWLTFDRTTAEGSATASYAVALNTTLDVRVATATVAGQAVEVTQAGAPGLRIVLDKASYTAGDAVVATDFRLLNPSDAAVKLRLQVLYRPAQAPWQVQAVDIGGGGSLSIPAHGDLNLGPLTLFTIGPVFSTPGSWELTSRATDPETGALISEDVKTFAVQ